MTTTTMTMTLPAGGGPATGHDPEQAALAAAVRERRQQRHDDFRKLEAELRLRGLARTLDVDKLSAALEDLATAPDEVLARLAGRLDGAA